MQTDADFDEVADQLTDELEDRLRSLSRIVPVADPSIITKSVRAAARQVSRRLGEGEPSGRAAAMQVVHALWADGAPPRSWWHTPLGRALAACGASDPEQVPYRSVR